MVLPRGERRTEKAALATSAREAAGCAVGRVHPRRGSTRTPTSSSSTPTVPGAGAAQMRKAVKVRAVERRGRWRRCGGGRAAQGEARSERPRSAVFFLFTKSPMTR